MEKIYKSLACPICKDNNNDITINENDEYTKEKKDDCTIIHIHRMYNCHCNKCQNNYNIDYGYAKLTRYNPYLNDEINDIKLFVLYESQFDRSYSIAEMDGIPMIFMEDDECPIIVGKNDGKELINNHEEVKRLTYNTWMHRHR